MAEHLLILIITILRISTMSQQDKVVDYNPQITLIKAPSNKYPAEEEVFQLKYLPPVPTDQVQKGEVVLRNLFLSIDAAMRVWISGVKTYMDPVRPGDLMVGAGVGEVIYSNDPKFKIGDIALGLTRWKRYSVIKAKELTHLPKNYPNYSDFLGVLGISGLTAYFGLKKIGNLKAGETVLVSAAAGGVGEIAVQLAKIAGCRVVAIVGSKEKCEYIKSLGADEAIDYKKESLKDKLREYCPKGVNVYFDNVGGEMLDEVLMHIRDFSRIIACGAISSYNSDLSQRYKIKNYPRIIIKRAIIQGFIYFDYKDEIPQAVAELGQLLKEGKLKSKINLYNGVEEAPHALKALLTGQNQGKVIVQVDKQVPRATL
jgi:NADPH-dependent curcumin reductase